MSEIVDAWIVAVEAKQGSEEYEKNWWAIDKVMVWQISLEKKSEELWQFIKTAYVRSSSDKVMGVLAAGPVEGLLAENGAHYIDQVEELAGRDGKFNRLLGGVWRSTMTPEIWSRIQKARKEVW
jgi:hypothetical protein